MDDEENAPFFLIMDFPNISYDKIGNDFDSTCLYGKSQAYFWIYDLWGKTQDIMTCGKFNSCDSDTISLSNNGNGRFKFIKLANNETCLVIDCYQVYLVRLTKKE